MQCYEIEYKEAERTTGSPIIIQKKSYVHAACFGDAEDLFIEHDPTAKIISIELMGPSLCKNTPKPSSQPPGDKH